MAHAERSGKAWGSLAYRKREKNFEESGHAALNIFHETGKPMLTNTHKHTHNLRGVSSVLLGLTEDYGPNLSHSPFQRKKPHTGP